jgi:hypothetical protein
MLREVRLFHLEPREERADRPVSRQQGEILAPEVNDVGVGDRGGELLAKARLDEKTAQVGESAAFAALQKRHHRVLENDTHLVAQRLRQSLKH